MQPLDPDPELWGRSFCYLLFRNDRKWPKIPRNQTFRVFTRGGGRERWGSLCMFIVTHPPPDFFEVLISVVASDLFSNHRTRIQWAFLITGSSFLYSGDGALGSVCSGHAVRHHPGHRGKHTHFKESRKGLRHKDFLFLPLLWAQCGPCSDLLFRLFVFWLFCFVHTIIYSLPKWYRPWHWKLQRWPVWWDRWQSYPCFLELERYTSSCS